MCDPLTLTSLVVGAGSAAFGALSKQPKPPKAQLPAPAQITSEPSAVVKVGNLNDPAVIPGSTSQDSFSETRATGGIPLGNLGRSGLLL